ncbi:MAG: S-layer homology domain-containing protein, partial [Peptoniphilus lacydonensis]|nr:S-layer homology domain-containing protein [Peptoniphilus lacydonensis]
EVETIRLVDKNSQFKAMLQVIDVRNSSGFRNIYSNEITLKVIQSDNKKLKIGETFIMSNAYTFDRYKVLTCDGYLDTNNNVSALFNIKEEGRAESELRDLYRINESGRFRTYDEVIKDNKGYNGRDNYYSRDINSFS